MMREAVNDFQGLSQRAALHATSVRYYELAEDLIDKLDRNLFERNCDCQAWATFEAIVEAANSTSDWATDEVFEKHHTTPSIGAANELLEKLMTTYVVYSDIFLLNQRGVVIGAGKNRQWIGRDWSEEP